MDRSQPLPPIAIYGGSGFIGRYLARHFSSRAAAVFASYASHPFELAGVESFHHDLTTTEPADFLETHPEVRIAIIAAAIPLIDDCRRDPERSRAVNVTGTARLLDALRGRAVFPVFLSTDCVFAGQTEVCRETDLARPEILYGRQKREIEERILESFERCLILRLAKIVGTEIDDGSLFVSWLEPLRQGKRIRAAEDQMLQPTWVGDVADAIERLIRGEHSGLYHVANSELASRFELARRFCEFFGFDPSLVEPCRMEEFDLLEKKPEGVFLNAEKLMAATGLKFRSITECFEQIQAHAREGEAPSEPSKRLSLE